MKLSESVLRQIVKQELEAVLHEADNKTRLAPSQADIEAVESSEEPDPKNPIAKWYSKRKKKQEEKGSK